MGKPLKNAPVYFTVVQVRFNSLLKLSDYLPSAQEAFRKAGFPAFSHQPTMAFQVVMQEGQAIPHSVPRDQFFFSNIDQTHSFVLTMESLTFQSTNYGTFEKFSSAFLAGLSLLNDLVGLDFTERMGLRYLDFVLPKKSEFLGLYLEPEVIGLGSKLAESAVHAYTESLTEVDGSKLLTRVLIQDGGIAFPPDLLPQSMAVQKRFLEMIS